MTTISITQPDDWHLHVRDGEVLKTVVPHTARCFGRAIIMPNLKPPVTKVTQAKEYRQRILDALPQGSAFEPLMTLYLTDNTSADDIKQAKESGIVHAVKYYPAGATTNSDFGVSNLDKVVDTLAAMEQHDLPLLVHGEVVDAEVDVFDREKIFIERVLHPLRQTFPDLRIVFEHITTEDAVAYVKQSQCKTAATITPQHLLFNRNEIFKGGIRPHYYCLPVLKRARHQQALIEAATSGTSRFFLGTDSAPHGQRNKESACGCAGIYSAHAAIELYATAFDDAGKLDKLEGFASHFGPDFYQLPRNKNKITLSKESWEVPASYGFADDKLIPLLAGQSMAWKFINVTAP